ncbi:alpha/beta hydrolase [Thiothrix lacustris]|uniref:Alpha/beta hydrolase n=1 Tax=Thiothrix lacustris TaxID=525917 RepID=A0ABY9MVC3_9GAMM|nr:alpha/beta hydrolase [Thiothrix lacustris]WML92452.1 alpha/beta hydrolase [Thiothrix lacustris]
MHGIWMRPWVLGRLAGRLRALGYVVIVPAYASVRLTPAANAERLYPLLQTVQTDTLHLVAHSLGGLVALHLLEKHPDLPPGRLVTLGTPAQGSKIARTIKPIPVLGKVFGNSMLEGLSGNGVPHRIGREWGAVIGTLPFGLGFPFLRGETSDGAVLVSEARHPAQTARIEQRVSHTGMLFSPLTFTYIQHFLQSGQFSSSIAPVNAD